jgi:putative membrane protein
MYYNHMNGGGGGGWVILLVIMILLIIIIVASAAVWLFLASARRRSGGTHPQSARPNAADLLDERLARGEIGPDEYRERLAALRERGPAG